MKLGRYVLTWGADTVLRDCAGLSVVFQPLQRRTVSASPTTVPSAHIFAWTAARSHSSSNTPRFVHNDRLCATPPRPQAPAAYSARRKAPRHAPERFAH